MAPPLVDTPPVDIVGTSTGDVELDELDASELLNAATRSVTHRRAAEVEEMRIARQWAVLHGEPRGKRDRMILPGGEGTPEVRDACVAELGMARETHEATARGLIADALDLAHRLPRTHRIVQDLKCEPWVARKVASLSRNLDANRVTVVDRAVAKAIAGHAPSTVIELARAKVIEADPVAYARRRETERHRRHVSLSRSDEFGYRQIIARVTSGDAVWIDAMVDRVADILALDHAADHNRDELRSLALGWLARPADLLKLLCDHTTAAEPEADDATDPGEPEDRRPTWAPFPLDQTLGRLAELSTRQLASLRGNATVFVHVTDESLRRQSGIARVEGGANGGPMLVQCLSELLGHCDVTVQPVLDLADRSRVDSYEFPDRIKDQGWHLAGGDCFPFSVRSARRDNTDYDHVRPFLLHGPPGQTGAHNCGPLRRRHHNWKTHAGYRCRQAGPGRYLWQTPHGLCFLVDQQGTRRLDPAEAEIILTAPPGVDLYLPGVVLELAA